MEWVKAVRVNKPETGGERRQHSRTAFKKHKTMKILTKLAVAAVMLTTAFAARAEMVSGYFRNDGTYVAPYYRSDYGSLGGYSSSFSSSSRDYVDRNPSAAAPSERVSGYTRHDGTTVLPYYRTPANDTVTDNLSYRGYGTVRVPRSSSRW